MQTLVKTVGQAQVCVILNDVKHICTDDNSGLSMSTELQDEVISLIKAGVLNDEHLLLSR